MALHRVWCARSHPLLYEGKSKWVKYRNSVQKYLWKANVQQQFSKHGSQTSISIPWELVRKAHSQCPTPPKKPTESEPLGVGDQQSVFSVGHLNQILPRQKNVENHWPEERVPAGRGSRRSEVETRWWGRTEWQTLRIQRSEKAACKPRWEGWAWLAHSQHSLLSCQGQMLRPQLVLLDPVCLQHLITLKTGGRKGYGSLKMLMFYLNVYKAFNHAEIYCSYWHWVEGRS